MMRIHQENNQNKGSNKHTGKRRAGEKGSDQALDQTIQNLTQSDHETTTLVLCVIAGFGAVKSIVYMKHEKATFHLFHQVPPSRRKGGIVIHVFMVAFSKYK
jgi:hypothetical protein